MALKDIFKRKEKPAQVPVKDKPKSSAVVKKSAPVKKVTPVKKADVKQMAHEIICYPLITEKVTFIGRENKYSFAVNLKATKNEVKKAISEMYNVQPLKVNIINSKGRSVRWGRESGQTKAWKKAIVTLPVGQKIELVEGV